MTERVVVVGAGVIGLSIAWRAASSGFDVLLVDPEPGSGASVVAAGMLAPVTEAHYGEESLLQLNLASNAIYPEWVAQLESYSGVATGYRKSGTLVVARDRDDDAALDHLFLFQSKLGLSVERLRSRECRDREPGLARDIRGGIFVASDHQIEPRLLVDALLKACDAVGVTFVREPVTSVEEAVGGGCVHLESGDLVEGGQVVLATGAHSRKLVRSLVDLPVRPVKGQVVELSPYGRPAPFDHNLRGLDVYMVARGDGRVTIGATVEEQGFDDRPTAEGVHDLLRYAYELAPGVLEMAFDGVRVGFRPGTPDNAPLLGRVAGAPWLIAATGHYRNGILLAPITAESTLRVLLDGESPPELLPFTPDRFAVRSEAS